MNTAVFSGLGKYRDFGLLVLRLGLGVAFVLHGYPKIAGGPERWEKLGGAMGILGVDLVPVVWGFLAAFAELGGGILLILGLFTRVATLLLLATMAVATASHLDRGDPLGTVLRPIELGVVFLSLLFLGPGAHSIDRK
jgi:putative oxidoreductase